MQILKVEVEVEVEMHGTKWYSLSYYSTYDEYMNLGMYNLLSWISNFTYHEKVK